MLSQFLLRINERLELLHCSLQNVLDAFVVIKSCELKVYTHSKLHVEKGHQPTA